MNDACRPNIYVFPSQRDAPTSRDQVYGSEFEPGPTWEKDRNANQSAHIATFVDRRHSGPVR